MLKVCPYMGVICVTEERSNKIKMDRWYLQWGMKHYEKKYVFPHQRWDGMTNVERMEEERLSKNVLPWPRPEWRRGTPTKKQKAHMKFTMNDLGLESWENRLLWKLKMTNLWWDKETEKMTTFVIYFNFLPCSYLFLNVPSYEQEMPRILRKQSSLLCSHSR